MEVFKVFGKWVAHESLSLLSFVKSVMVIKNPLLRKHDKAGAVNFQMNGLPKRSLPYLIDQPFQSLIVKGG